jgi:hypothetical protein
MTEPREDFRKLMRAYAAFQMATALFVVAKSVDGRFAGFIVSLFAISIPSTIAYAGFARLTPDDEKRNPANITFICGTLAFGTSIAAISLLFAGRIYICRDSLSSYMRGMVRSHYPVAKASADQTTQRRPLVSDESTQPREAADSRRVH